MAILAVYQFSANAIDFSEPRIDQAQVIGTHNSYHIAPHPSLDKLIRTTNDEFGDALDYTHRPLNEQFTRLGIRQIELDLYADPEGGHYSNPKGVAMAKAAGLPAVPDFDPENILDDPGLKVFHTPDIDYLTTVHTFKAALTEIQTWSDANPHHFPLTVLIELKEAPKNPIFINPVEFTEERILEVEKEILEVMDHSDLITPQHVRGKFPTLREAIIARGWPSIASSRGRIIFCLDNTGKHRDIYLKNDPKLNSRIIFPSVAEDHPAAGFFKINNPFDGFEKIQRVVKKGFLVRTRADSPTKNARNNDTDQRDKAFTSGAQLISTDYPEPNPSFSSYKVVLPNDRVAISNPVSGNPSFKGIDLENYQDTSNLESHVSPTAYLSRMAFKAHNKRSLGEASEYYRQLLKINPATEPSQLEKRLIIKLAPKLLTVKGEPFKLRDAIAIHHPEKPIIAYHLMWEDDIDFPEDNDPVDHEVLWVTYSTDTQTPTYMQTYFHGNILKLKANHKSFIGIEWGKHGSVPLSENKRITLKMPGLNKNWNRLHTQGIRKPNHPFASDWPKKFTGELNDYMSFETPVNLGKKLRSKKMMIKGRWANAIIDQIFLPYNFSAKIEWPE